MTLEHYQVNRQAYDELVHFKRVSKSQSVSSGQINVGCNSGANTETPILHFGKSPQITAMNAVWANTDHVQGQNQGVIESRDEKGVLTGVKAVGHMDGENTDWFGNCHGGAHGEVILHVEWSELEPLNVGISSGQ